MKKNSYFVVFIIWAIFCIAFTIFTAVFFVGGMVLLGLIFLILSVSFGFVSGQLLNNAILKDRFERKQKALIGFFEGLYSIQKKDENQPNDPFQEFN